MILARPDFLLHESFQRFVKNCLEKIGQEYRALLDNVNLMDKKLPHDNAMRVNLSMIIGPLSKQLTASLNAFLFSDNSGISDLVFAGEAIEAPINHVVISASSSVLALRDLVRVTSGYSKTIFGQAAYGQTRSAQALIAAIKDPRLNQRLPLASILFGSETVIDLSQITDSEIQGKLMSLKCQFKWEESADDIQLCQYNCSV